MKGKNKKFNFEIQKKIQEDFSKFLYISQIEFLPKIIYTKNPKNSDLNLINNNNIIKKQEF